MEKITLESLVGERVLCGADRLDGTSLGYGYCSDVIRFVLDGKTYTAVEDPVDDYRSCLGELFVSDNEVANRFPPVRVIAQMREDEWLDILDILDAQTGLVVLSVGTDYTDDYYPYFVADFDPRNMAVNQ